MLVTTPDVISVENIVGDHRIPCDVVIHVQRRGKYMPLQRCKEEAQKVGHSPCCHVIAMSCTKHAQPGQLWGCPKCNKDIESEQMSFRDIRA